MLGRIRRTFRTLLRRDQWERNLDLELREHVKLHASELERRGASPEDALRQARLELGSRERYKEEIRASSGVRLLDELRQDVRYSLRSLLRQPGFLAAVVLTLALGIGANTAVFTVVDATILRPLPYRDPASLMKISLVRPATPTRTSSDDALWSHPKYETFRDSQTVFERVATYDSTSYRLTSVDDPEPLRGELVNASYFPLLGVEAQLGRTFTEDEDRIAGKDFVVLLSHGLWVRRFGMDPAVIGRTIRTDRTYTVVGVLPPRFQGLTGPTDVWVPVHAITRGDDLPCQGFLNQSGQVRLRLVNIHFHETQYDLVHMT